MTVLPITVPASLLDVHHLAPGAGGWGFRVDHAVASAVGDTYVLTGLRRYRAHAAGSADPAEQDFGYQLITRYGSDGKPTATAVFGQAVPGGSPSAIPEREVTTLAVLPDGAVAVSSKPGSTHLLSPDLDEVLASWPMSWGWKKEQDTGDDPFAASIAVTPAGRLLCMTSEYGLSNWAGAHPNIVAVSEPGTALGPGLKPVLRAIATLDTRTDCQSDADSYAHVRYGDEPVGRGNRPSPSLAEALSELTGTSGSLYGYLDSTMTRPAALGDDLFVVPVFGKTYRSTNLGQEFSFALVDDRGVLRGRLGGLHLREDSPFTGFDFTVVADPYRARAFHLNRYGLYAWSADGALRARMSTAEKPFKPLVHFALLECTPAGELLLAHRKQHLLLRVPVPQDLDDLTGAVEAALKGYGRERTALKKQYTPVNWLWSDSAATVNPL
ncbi:hypothetical protein OG333_35910 [Streptomyces anulatus]|uniref:hypothetical protein n=1 Tax=Streptomyces TaxID=1883 RepID=UPI000BEFB83F|nr:hypothetical protein [Streptomyces sp. or20]WSV79432.1 hypothetical protein OG333_35910 [Streptomyces anulatus]